MIQEVAFNQGVLQVLDENPNSEFTRLLEKIKEIYPHKNSYYSILGGLTYELGFDFTIISVEVKKEADKYIPCFKYYPRNILGESERTERLVDIDSAMTIKEVYSFLGKETVYRISRIPDIDTIISSKRDSIPQ